MKVAFQDVRIYSDHTRYNHDTEYWRLFMESFYIDITSVANARRKNSC